MSGSWFTVAPTSVMNLTILLAWTYVANAFPPKYVREEYILKPFLQESFLSSSYNGKLFPWCSIIVVCTHEYASPETETQCFSLQALKHIKNNTCIYPFCNLYDQCRINPYWLQNVSYADNQLHSVKFMHITIHPRQHQQHVEQQGNRPGYKSSQFHQKTSLTIYICFRKAQGTRCKFAPSVQLDSTHISMSPTTGGTATRED